MTVTSDTAPTQPEGMLSLLDADPAFGRAVPADDRTLARRALMLRERTLAAGERVEVEERDVVALVVVAGTLWREVHAAGAHTPQLLPAGSVVLCAPSPGKRLVAEARSVALTDTRLAVLDRRFLLAATRWPALAGVLHGRLADQERDVAVQAALSQLPRVEDRLVGLLWHLAERWGRPGTDGVHVELRLTHATLGRFVGARRPTVSLALTQLRRGGVLERDTDGFWVLTGSVPTGDGKDDGGVHPPSLFAPERPA